MLFPFHMKYLIHSFPILLLLILLSLCACESKREKSPRANIAQHDGYADSLLLAETIDALSDSVAGEDGKPVSAPCAQLYIELTDLKERLEAVKSPDALIRAKKKYQEVIPRLNKANTTLDSQEKPVIQRTTAEMEAFYSKACREYEIPASGVIDNLKNLISRIDQIKTQQEFNRFQSARLGMLQGLDDIHLCVEQRSHHIAEVKRLAQTLKSKYEAKKQAFSHP